MRRRRISRTQRRQNEDARIPDRAFVASITTPEGARFTTTIYGRTAYKAEQIYQMTHPGSRAIARSEQL